MLGVGTLKRQHHRFVISVAYDMNALEGYRSLEKSPEGGKKLFRNKGQDLILHAKFSFLNNLDDRNMPRNRNTFQGVERKPSNNNK